MRFVKTGDSPNFRYKIKGTDIEFTTELHQDLKCIMTIDATEALVKILNEELTASKQETLSDEEIAFIKSL